ncbi:hypothetical protein E1A34_26725 [Salmonella enterica subsp. enterica serovar Newport]|uniref:Uncharacterized protein n=1 Tax=Salmonella newport TaxID=108619 RepID=A0A610XL96_SALNE|nr:hypothetical protein [Salmonella enterica subsp. enterica serovar Newport]EBS4408644.1 hypothetical protein [Salmonella enterica subsp. enterica serovar Newport]ECB7109585.1 hypothetical protein [Salmonella enterica subsp. enterica serovar Newport]ECF2112317.1 hypothetical protein [Salmonella enterica subsp. enterica serovar Newport]ECJ3621514.1 hypothetical protein [Salmonella enterica subsp. enterica serovar Newport]
MQEQKRPILSIKRKPSLMYQKPSQKPDSEKNATQPEQAATVTTTKAKPKYKGLPEWKDVSAKFGAWYLNFFKSTR